MIGAAVAVVTAAIGAGPLTEALVVRQVEVVLAAKPFANARHGAVRYSFWLRELAIEDLSVETVWPALRSLRAGRLVIDGLPLSALIGTPPTLALERASGTRVEVTNGDFVVSAESLALSAITIAGSLDSTGPAPDGDRLAPLFASVAVHRVEMHAARLRNDRQHYDLTVEDLSAEDFAEGRLKKVAASNIVSKLSAASVEFSALEIAALDGAAWRRAYDASAPLAGPNTPLLGSLAASGVTLATSEGRLSAASLALADLRGRPETIPPAATWPGDLKWLAGLTVARAEVDAIELAGTVGSDAHVTLAHVALRGIEPGKLGALEMRGLALALPQGIVRLGAAEIGGLSYVRSPTPRAWPHLFIERLRLADLAAGAKPGAEVSVKEMLVTMEGSIAAPRGGSLRLDTVTVPATALPSLTLVGYNELVMDYEGHSTIDVAAARIEGSQRLTARQGGSLTMTMRLDNFPLPAEPQELRMAVSRFMQTRLEFAELRYDDASLADRLMRLYAGGGGHSLEAARNEILREATAHRQYFVGKPAMQAVFDRIEAFVREPRSLTLTVQPPRPIPFGALSSLATLPEEEAFDALGFSLH